MDEASDNSPLAVRALKEIIDEALPVDEALELESARTRELRSLDYTASRFRAAASRVVGD